MQIFLPGMVIASCTSGTVDCDDVGISLVGPPLWLLIVISVVAVAVVVAVVATIVRAVRRRRARVNNTE